MSVPRAIVPAGCALLLASLSGCRQPSAATRESASSQIMAELGASAAAAGDLARTNVYPPGKWRLLPAAELGATMLWLSDIVIRHSGVSFPNVSFNHSGWLTAEPLQARSQQEALARAEEVVRRARDGESFEDLAREYSDELETSSRGGSLGGVLASHLLPWPHVLDALETLGPGEVSNVIETDTGYHVLLRRPPPPDVTVSGRRLVIAHDGAPWIALAARGPVPQRSRAEALALARDLYERARAQPAEFELLVTERSEHRDGARGGDFGTWSTREPTELPREVEVLAGLGIGEVAAPIDSLWGIQIIQRTEDRARERFAMASLELIYDPSRPESEPASRQSAQRRIEELSVNLREHPDRFAALQREYCCDVVSEIVSGRHSPALESALGQLAPEQITGEPIEEPNLRFMLVKRLPLTLLPRAPEIRYELAPHQSGGQL